MADEVPKEDRQANSDEAARKRLAGNQDWKEARRLLAQKILVMTSLLEMSDEQRKDPVECQARALAGEKINEWIGEIDGTLQEGAIIPEDDHDPSDPVLRIR